MAPQAKDLSKLSFGMLTVRERYDGDDHGIKTRCAVWLCDCTCGGITYASSGDLKNGSKKSCGCLRGKNLVDEVFGRLLVVEPGETLDRGKLWKCICECGRTKMVTRNHLTTGFVKSCGCLLRSADGECHIAERKHWYGIVRRCTNPNYIDYKSYGGAGITVCEYIKENYKHLIEIIGKKPGDEYSVDRWPDTEGSYTCGKCEECLRNEWELNMQWSTPQEQARHRTNNHPVTINGETKLICEWTEQYGFKKGMILRRINLNWPECDLLKPAYWKPAV